MTAECCSLFGASADRGWLYEKFKLKRLPCIETLDPLIAVDIGLRLSNLCDGESREAKMRDQQQLFAKASS